MIGTTRTTPLRGSTYASLLHMSSAVKWVEVGCFTLNASILLTAVTTYYIVPTICDRCQFNTRKHFAVDITYLRDETIAQFVPWLSSSGRISCRSNVDGWRNAVSIGGLWSDILNTCVHILLCLHFKCNLNNY